ncbi:MAG: hypothetical protein ACLP0J_02865 [Solirubrobacteraceae bacterium]
MSTTYLLDASALIALAVADHVRDAAITTQCLLFPRRGGLVLHESLRSISKLIDHDKVAVHSLLAKYYRHRFDDPQAGTKARLRDSIEAFHHASNAGIFELETYQPFFVDQLLRTTTCVGPIRFKAIHDRLWALREAQEHGSYVPAIYLKPDWWRFPQRLRNTGLTRWLAAKVASVSSDVVELDVADITPDVAPSMGTSSCR